MGSEKETARHLAELGLGPDASLEDVRQAYRALARIWHPDRSARDPGLQGTAEETFKRISGSYAWLVEHGRLLPRSTLGEDGRLAPRPERRARPWRWAVGFALVLALGVLAAKAWSPGDAAALAPESAPRPATARSETPARRASVTAPPEVRAEDLHPADRESLEAACAVLKRLPDATAYRDCLARQLKLLEAAPARPSLAGLSARERESIEATCAGAKYLEGPAAYNRCLVRKRALLERHPEPDSAALAPERRHAIESACAGSRLDGPAAYNRCLAERSESPGGSP